MAKTASSAKKADGGNTLSARLARLGLTTQAALLTHLPLRYEDETRITALRDVRDGVPAQVHVEVVECSVQFRPRRQLLVRVRDTSDDGEDATLRFLNFYPSQQKQMEAGARLRVFGEARVGFAGPFRKSS